MDADLTERRGYVHKAVAVRDEVESAGESQLFLWSRRLNAKLPVLSASLSCVFSSFPLHPLFPADNTRRAVCDLQTRQEGEGNET